MHVLITNDDGPPSEETSPFVHHLINALKELTDWKISVVLPHTQRSWIGKAHLIGQTLTATYIYPSSTEVGKYDGPYLERQKDRQGAEEWALLDGTPASCTNVGLHYLTEDKGPVDLVISGPNLGRNSSALYIMSSGTVGAAMEGALCGVRAIGVSFGFQTMDENERSHAVDACRMSVRIIKHLYANWNPEAQLYSVNVPLYADLNDKTKIVYTEIFDNLWGASFQPDKKAEEGETENKNLTQFVWQPNFAAVDASVKNSGPNTDAGALNRGNISVTPLKAAFKGVPMSGEIKLGDRDDRKCNTLVYISTPESNYVYSLWKNALKKYGFAISSGFKPSKGKVFEYAEYDDLEFDRLMSDHDYLACSYIYRKALIRKHYLSNVINVYSVKNPDSILKFSFPDSFNIEVDYAEFLDDALDEAYELRDEIEAGTKTWILKPSMSDRAQGIRIFNSLAGLQEIFDSYEEENEDDENDLDNGDGKNGIITSQLRHFIVQEYISRPLLLPEYDNKKFHIRTYVLAAGALKVYVYRDMLALFAESTYMPPGGDDVIDLAGQLTNTCIQDEETKQVSVQAFWELRGLYGDRKESIFQKICNITQDLFKAAVSVDRINFQPLPNAFEFYGLDFLVDSDGHVFVLEVNCYPDFKQTGEDLQQIVQGLFECAVKVAVNPHFGGSLLEDDKLEKVFDKELRGKW